MSSDRSVAVCERDAHVRILGFFAGSHRDTDGLEGAGRRFHVREVFLVLIRDAVFDLFNAGLKVLDEDGIRGSSALLAGLFLCGGF